MGKTGLETLNIDKLATTGEGMGRVGGRKFKIIGALPGETVEARILRRKKGILFAEAIEIITPASYRRDPQEPHFLSGSPWQIIPEDRQLEIKKELALQIFRERAGALPAELVEIVESASPWGYRNKMEFSFTGSGGPAKLAFHKRYRKYDRYEVVGSRIAAQAINTQARRILEEIREKKIDTKDLKSLVVRYSFSNDVSVAALYVGSESAPIISKLVGYGLAGFLQIYSDPRSPASVTTKVSYSEGETNLCERLNGMNFIYPYDGFFQVNPKSFEQLIKYLRESLPDKKSVLDLYSGVGTIGILLSDRAERVTLVESHPVSAGLAKTNAKVNGAANVSVYSGEVEKQDLRELLSKTEVLVVDPPRSGLHPRLVRRILENPPEQMLYVSCNPHTQADDWDKLRTVYSVADWKLFDLYPQTPHMESVLVLKRA